MKLFSRRWRALCWPVASLIVATVFLTSCDDSSPSGPNEPSDFSVYFSDPSRPDRGYEYHIGTGELEEFVLPTEIDGPLRVSADGRYLLASVGEQTAVFDARTRETVTTLPLGSWLGIEFSRDGQLLALEGTGFFTRV